MRFWEAGGFESLMANKKGRHARDKILAHLPFCILQNSLAYRKSKNSFSGLLIGARLK